MRMRQLVSCGLGTLLDYIRRALFLVKSQNNTLSNSTSFKVLESSEGPSHKKILLEDPYLQCAIHFPEDQVT